MGETHVILGTGPLGRYTAEALVARGLPVRLVNGSGRRAAAPGGAEVVACDVLSPALADAVKGAATVYQCAQPAYHRWAQEFPALQRAVVDATAAASAKLVVAENLYMYGDPRGRPMTEDTPLRPCSRKGRVRAAMTQDLFAAHHAGRVRVASVRGSDFWGPWEPIQGEMVFRAALEGRPLTLVGRLDQPHSFTYVKDFGAALATAGTDDRALGRPWHVPSGDPVPLGALVRAIGDHLDDRPKVRTAGQLLLSALGLFSPGAREMVEMLYEFTAPFVVDASAMETTFGLRATPMAQRIAETLAWVAGRGESSPSPR
jgi:nucleoside-diphosphate-sugar epimerase